jgi:hypothetical protein
MKAASQELGLNETITVDYTVGETPLFPKFLLLLTTAISLSHQV